MKTKFYLAALCLPMAFAACTNDELMEDTQALSGKTIDLVLTAEKPAIGIGSRMTIDGENNFVWEKDVDMIGAATFTSGSNNVLINYPFVAQNDAKTSTFNGKSSVMAGKYLFYYGYQDIVKAGPLGLDVPTQTYDASKTESALEQIAGQMKMISPMVDLINNEDKGYINGISYEKAQSLNLAVPFVNLYSAVKVNITPSNIAAGAQPKVTKVALAGQSGSLFNVKNLVANQSVIADAATLVPTADGTVAAEDVEEVKATLEEIIANGTVYTDKGPGNDAKATGEVVLNVKGDCVLANGKTTSLYLLVPKGTYTNGVIVTVETSEGTYTRTNITDEVTFDNDITQIGATPNFAVDGTGDVILPTTFNIASAEEWAEKVAFVKSHDYIGTAITFHLTKDVEITAVPDIKVQVTAATDKSLVLAGNMTLGASNLTKFAGSTAPLKIKAGAVVNLNTELTNVFGTVTNEGTLNLTVDPGQSLMNWGILNINKDVETTATIENGREKDDTKNPKVTEKAGTINIAAEKVVTLGTTLINKVGSINIAADAVLENGTSGSITNKGTITNKGELKAVTNTGTIDNYGVISAVVTNSESTANGTVLVQKDSKATASISGGIVDVKDLEAIATYTTPTNATVTALVNNSKEFKAADGVGAINNIKLNGGEWTLVAAADDATTTKQITLSSLTTALDAPSITLKSATLNLNGQADLAATTNVVNLIADGANNNLTSATAVTVNTNDNKGGIVLTVNKGATLNVGKNITANAAKSAIEVGTKATVNGTLNVLPGAKMYFNNATVGTDGAIYVKGANGDEDNNQAVFGVKETFTNGGIVKAEAKKNGVTGDKGQVSAPSGDGTFGGGASSTISFGN